MCISTISNIFEYLKFLTVEITGYIFSGRILVASSPKRILIVNGLNSRPTLFIALLLEAGDNLREEMLRWCFMHQGANRIGDKVYKEFGAHGLVVLRGVMLGNIDGRITLTWAPVDQELFLGHSILDPVKAHIYSFGMLLFHGGV